MTSAFWGSSIFPYHIVMPLFTTCLLGYCQRCTSLLVEQGFKGLSLFWLCCVEDSSALAEVANAWWQATVHTREGLSECLCTLEVTWFSLPHQSNLAPVISRTTRLEGTFSNNSSLNKMTSILGDNPGKPRAPHPYKSSPRGTEDCRPGMHWGPERAGAEAHS